MLPDATQSNTDESHIALKNKDDEINLYGVGEADLQVKPVFDNENRVNGRKIMSYDPDAKSINDDQRKTEKVSRQSKYLADSKMLMMPNNLYDGPLEPGDQNLYLNGKQSNVNAGSYKNRTT